MSFHSSRSNALDRERGPAPTDVAIPVETAPGAVAQVDFGYAGKRYDPERGTLRGTSSVRTIVEGIRRDLEAFREANGRQGCAIIRWTGKSSTT